MSRWPTPPLGSLVETIVPARDKPQELNGPIPWLRIEDFDGQYVSASATGQGVTAETVAAMNLKVFPKGTVICTCSCSMGTTAIAAGSIITNQTFIGLLPRGEALESRFLYWSLQGFRDHLNATATGAIQQYLSRDDFRQLRLPVPAPSDQRAIADYLDTETARIDALIDKKRRMVQLLADRHLQRVRDVTCCSGLGRPLRRVVSTVKTGTTPRVGVETFDGDAEWVTPGDFADGLLLLSAARLVPAAVVHTGEVPLFPPGSILVVGIGATAGKVAFADRAVSSNQQVTAIVPGPDIDGRFLAWQMWSRASELRDLAPYTTLPILNNEFLRSFPVNVPTLALQREVVRSVDGQWAETQALQLRLNRQTDLLRERRQALITAAVTGELEIPGVAA